MLGGTAKLCLLGILLNAGFKAYLHSYNLLWGHESWIIAILISVKYRFSFSLDWTKLSVQVYICTFN